MYDVFKDECIKEGKKEGGDDHVDECEVVELLVGGGAFAFEHDGGKVEFVNVNDV